MDSLCVTPSKAALVAGAHGVLVEVHPEPEKALSDGPQSLTFPGFEALMADFEVFAELIGSVHVRCCFFLLGLSSASLQQCLGLLGRSSTSRTTTGLASALVVTRISAHRR